MALVQATIETEIRKIIDQNYFAFAGHPINITAAAIRWSNAVNAYAGSVVPASTTVIAAKAVFEAEMLSISPALGNALIVLPIAFTNYCITLATGMAGFVSVPPPVPINFATIPPIGLGGGTSAQIATAMAVLIDTYFRTGTATPIGGGASIPWS